MQSTIQLFQYLYEHLPPLVPEEIVLAMKKELDFLENNNTVTLPEIEDTMIQFGYQVWPWNQAYKYFLQIIEEQLGEHFLLPTMSNGLQEKYLNFKAFGGTLADLHSGRPASFFTSEQRGELCEKLVNMKIRLKEYLNRDLVGINQKQYLNKVEEYKRLLEKIKFNLESLRNFVDKEEEGSRLAEEINTKIKDFEHSLCLLGSEMDYEAVCQAHDFFTGRKTELSRLRGIDIPMQIDFYNSEG
jgi:hypothetical protein